MPNLLTVPPGYQRTVDQLWTPQAIQTTWWLDAADPNTIIDSGGAVSQWNDKSIKQIDLTQGTASKQPTTDARTLGGLNVLEFDGTDVFQTNQSKHGTSYLVAIMLDYDSGSSVLSESSSGGSQSFTIGDAGVTLQADSNIVYSGGSLSGPTLLVLKIDRVLNVATIYRNGISEGTSALTADVGGGVAVRIGSNFVGGISYDGGLGEVVYSDNITDTTRQLLEGYLAWKWGTTLPVGHPYEFARPTMNPIWTPHHVEKLGWYDPSDISTITDTAGAVSQIDDKSGTEHLVQAVGSKQPTTGTRTINGLNVLDHDGDDFLEKLSFTLPSSGDVAFFMVCEIDSVDNTFDSIFSVNGTTDFQLEARSPSQFLGALKSTGLGGGIINFVDGPYDGAGTIIMCAIFDKTNSLRYVFSNGAEQGSDVYTTKLSPTTILSAFTNRAADASPNGAMGEFIITSNVSAYSRQKIEGYLAWKWGSVESLPVDHPYKTDGSLFGY
jgi:hypothetical protein